MKKATAILLCTLFVLMGIPVIAFALEEEEPAPTGEDTPIPIAAPSAILLDGETGQVLLEKNAKEKLPAASAIKVMTLLVLYDGLEQGRIQMEDRVEISPKAAGMGGTRAFLDAGQSYTVEALVKAIGVSSANDAAVALAEATYGSEDAFVTAMNERAQALGAVDTVFTTCTGLDDENSYTTAYDLGIIGAALSKHRLSTQHTSIYMDQLSHPKDGRTTELTNPNRLVRFYESCDGYATGSSGVAKYCGVFTAKKGETRLVAVVLKAKDSTTRFDDARGMLEYGFANFRQRMLAKKGEILRKGVEVPQGVPRTVNLVAKEDVRVVVRRGEENNIRKEVALLEDIQLPVESGQPLGTLNIYLGDILIAQVDVVAEHQVKKATLWEAVQTILRYWLMG